MLVTSRDFVRPRRSSASLFTALPSSRDGTHLTDAALQVAVGLRLGLQVATPGQCSCGAQLDARVDHALSCRQGVGRHARHRLVNACIKQGLADAGIVSVLEPPGTTLVDSKRPDGATVLPYDNGLSMAWDATIIHTCAPSRVQVTAVKSGSGAAAAKIRKEAKYAPFSGRILFRPVGIETLGAFGAPAVRRNS